MTTQRITEAHKAKKTEHSGAKHGHGAYWGKKKDAKKESDKARRRQDKKESELKESPDSTVIKQAGWRIGKLKGLLETHLEALDEALIAGSDGMWDPVQGIAEDLVGVSQNILTTAKRINGLRDNRSEWNEDLGLNTDAVIREALLVNEGLDHETLWQFIDMARESAELEGEVDMTEEVAETAALFEEVLHKALSRWIQAFGQFALHPDVTVDDFMDEGEAAYNVLMTLRGEGVGIWDGRWDKFFVVDPEEGIKNLGEFLKLKLGKFADDTGGGMLNDAFQNAAYETTGQSEVDEGLDTERVLGDALSG